MAAYAQQWKKLLAPWRKTSDARREDTLNAVRNPFLVDYDRLIFASSSIRPFLLCRRPAVSAMTMS